MRLFYSFPYVSLLLCSIQLPTNYLFFLTFSSTFPLPNSQRPQNHETQTSILDECRERERLDNWQQKVTHTNTVHERFFFWFLSKVYRAFFSFNGRRFDALLWTEVNLAVRAFFSAGLVAVVTEQKLQRQELEASALKKERSTWSSKLQRLLSCTVLAGPLLLQPSRVQGNFTTITRKNQTFKPLQSDT